MRKTVPYSWFVEALGEERARAFIDAKAYPRKAVAEARRVEKAKAKAEQAERWKGITRKRQERRALALMTWNDIDSWKGIAESLDISPSAARELVFRSAADVFKTQGHPDREIAMRFFDSVKPDTIMAHRVDRVLGRGIYARFRRSEN